MNTEDESQHVEQTAPSAPAFPQSLSTKEMQFLSDLEATPAARTKATRATAPKRVAILYVHGMGVQVPFAGIQDVVSGLVNHGGFDMISDPSYGTQALGNTTSDLLSSLTMRVTYGAVEKDVHVFEAFWSPIPKGTANFADAMSFLISTGYDALNRGSNFRRWMFGKYREKLRVKPGTSIYLALALGIIGTLYAFQAYLLGATLMPGALNIRPAQQLLASYLLFGVLGCGAIVGGLIMIASSVKKRWVTWVSYGAFLLFCVGACGAGIALVLAAVYPSISSSLSEPVHPRIWTGIAFALAFGLQRFVQSYALNFIGDLAAYLCGFRASKFQKVRDQVQQKVGGVFDAVYGMRFDSIIVVGHSEGSVIAYDALNAKLLRDPSALHQTKALITLGSPLDKVAFLFRNQAEESDLIREALASSRQPLISDANVRQHIPWINVWSPFDVVSGELAYYNAPGIPNVQNIEDEEAFTALACHSHYWQHETLPRKLAAQLLS